MGLNVGTPWRCGLNRGISLAEEVSISARIRKTAIALVLVFLCSQAAGCALTGKPGSPRTDSAKPTVSASPTFDLLGAYTIRANTGEGPNVREVTVREERKMAVEFCTDLLQQGLSKAQIALRLLRHQTWMDSTLSGSLWRLFALRYLGQAPLQPLGGLTAQFRR